MSATGPNAIVARRGEPVVHEYVEDYELDANGQVDPASVRTRIQEIPAIVSQPRREDEQRLEGRLQTGGIRMTVPSDVDIRADRGGQRDLIYRIPVVEWGDLGWGVAGWGESSWGGSYYPDTGWGDLGWGESGWGGTMDADVEHEPYQVIEVRSDRNPMTGTEKQTVIANRHGGRS